MIAARNNSKAWFKPLRHSYIPVNSYGALTYIPFVAFLIATLWLPLHFVHPKVIAVLIALPNWVVATSGMTMLAKDKS